MNQPGIQNIGTSTSNSNTGAYNSKTGAHQPSVAVEGVAAQATWPKANTSRRSHLPHLQRRAVVVPASQQQGDAKRAALRGACMCMCVSEGACVGVWEGNAIREGGGNGTQNSHLRDSSTCSDQAILLWPTPSLETLLPGRRLTLPSRSSLVYPHLPCPAPSYPTPPVKHHPPGLPCPACPAHPPGRRRSPRPSPPQTAGQGHTSSG